MKPTNSGHPANQAGELRRKNGSAAGRLAGQKTRLFRPARWFQVAIWVWILGWVQAWGIIGTVCDPQTDFTELYLVRNWEQLPHKNQEETPERVAAVNARLGRAQWRCNPQPNKPLYVCLSYTAASVADWWALELGRELGTYTSFAHGREEQGYNPRKLELRYRKRARIHPFAYGLIRWVDRCPVSGASVPIRPKGFAQLLVDDRPDVIADRIDGTVFEYRPGDYPMENQWFALVNKNWDKAEVEAKLLQGLRDYGPLVVQFEMPKQHFLFGTHTALLVGHGKLPDGRVALICHDSFGNFPKSHVQDAAGAGAYRYIYANEVDEALAFPHQIKAVAVRNGARVNIGFFNSGDRPVPVRRAFYLMPDLSGKANPGTADAHRQASTWTNANEVSLPPPPNVVQRRKPVRAVPMDMTTASSAVVPADAFRDGLCAVYVEADYYMQRGGKGHWLSVFITAAEAAPEALISH